MKIAETLTFWEELNANSWPAFGHILYDGWLLRFTKGYSLHNNSVWPLYSGTLEIESKVAYCESAYAARGMRCNFRLAESRVTEALASFLIKRGYRANNPNLLMSAHGAQTDQVIVEELSLISWLDEIYRIHPVEDEKIKLWEQAVLERLALSARYVIVKRDNQSCGYGRSVRQGSYMQIEDIWTQPEYRKQGVGRQLVQGLMNLGSANGATTFWLTVNESNQEAQRLYQRLRFTNKYKYRYFGRPD